LDPAILATFEDDAQHQSFRLELSQIVTTRLIINVGVEAVTDEGYLNNPYRSVRFQDSSSAIGYSYQAENVEVSCTHPIGDHWELDANFRYYDQTNADFYAYIFAFQDAQNFLARDKELAALNSTSISGGASYTFGQEGFWIFSKGSVNLYVDYVMSTMRTFLM
jgi:hypothetical protein